MTLLAHTATRRNIVLWEGGLAVCSARTFTADHIVVTITVNDIVAEQERFFDSRSAAEFAVARMSDYYVV